MANSPLQDNWQFHKTLQERNSIMLDRQLGVDVRFAFEGKSKRFIGAHKYMLMSSSPVFWSMFNGALAVRNGESITITDVEYEAFGAMLRFIYCEQVQLTGDAVMQILYASKKYMIPSLTAKCSEFLEKNLTANNVCDIFDQALLFDEQNLVEKCLSIVTKDTKHVFASKSFTNISHVSLARVLQSEKLNVSEIDVFKACIQWAEAKKLEQSSSSEVTIRSILGELLYAIRFPTMSAEEFSDIVAPTGVLSLDEEVMCFRYICSTKHDKPTCGEFVTTKRGGFVSRLFLPMQDAPNMILQQNNMQQNQLNSTMQLHLDDGYGNQIRFVDIVGLRVLCSIGDNITLNFNPVDRRQLFLGRQNNTMKTVCHETNVQTQFDYQFTDVYFDSSKSVRLESGYSSELRVNIQNGIIQQLSVFVSPIRQRHQRKTFSQSNASYQNGTVCVSATGISLGIVIGLFIKHVK